MYNSISCSIVRNYLDKLNAEDYEKDIDHAYEAMYNWQDYAIDLNEIVSSAVDDFDEYFVTYIINDMKSYVWGSDYHSSYYILLYFVMDFFHTARVNNLAFNQLSTFLETGDL